MRGAVLRKCRPWPRQWRHSTNGLAGYPETTVQCFAAFAALRDAGFFAEQYWIGDPDYYHLPPAYGPYRWVRYYNDALLVNIYNGAILDEIPDFFW